MGNGRVSHCMKSSHFACADGLTPRKHTVCLGTALCLHCQILSHCECSAVVYSNKNEKSKKKSTPPPRQRGRVESERLAETWTFSKSQKVASPRRLTPLEKVEKVEPRSKSPKVEPRRKSQKVASPKADPFGKSRKVEKVQAGRVSKD